MRGLFLTALLGGALAAGSLTACGGDDAGPGSGSGAGSTTSTTSGTGGDGATGGGGASPDDPVKPAPGGMRRLLKAQYIESIRVLFGDVGAAAAEAPGDQALKGMDSIGAAELTTSSSQVDTYEQSARAVAAAVLADAPTRANVLPCEPASPTDAACLAQVVDEIGRVAWRRPLTQAESDRIVAAATTAGTAFNTVDGALGAAISALLQSFYFLYVVELGEPDAKDPTVFRLTPGELVTRMSLFLTDRIPDAALLDAADGGQLADDAGIKAIAKQLLAKPEAKPALDRFYAEVYRLRELDIMQKNATLFPQFTDTLRVAMKEETLRFLRDAVWDSKTDARTFFAADYTFVNAELAALYGISPPANDYDKVTLPASQERVGILGHAGLLSLLSHIDSTSPTRRGFFVQANLLCNPIPPPPSDVTPVFPPDDGMPKTMKTKLEGHMKDPSCAACHQYMDPIGLGLEHFDAIGAWREKDQGFDLDTSGDVPKFGQFTGAKGIAKVVHDDPRSTECMIRQFMRASMGHLETDGELPAVLRLDLAFADAGYRIQDLLVELTASDAFRLVGDPK